MTDCVACSRGLRLADAVELRVGADEELAVGGDDRRADHIRAEFVFVFHRDHAQYVTLGCIHDGDHAVEIQQIDLAVGCQRRSTSTPETDCLPAFDKLKPVPLKIFDWKPSID